MAVEATKIYQMPFVGTKIQKALVERDAKKAKVSRAQIIRLALDARYGLVDGQYPAGDPRLENPDAEVPVV